MQQKRLRLVAGLGNPGDTYKDTRHNAGFMVADELAEAFSIALKKRMLDVVFGKGFIEGVEVILAKPLSFMNRSGPSIHNLAQYFRLSGEDVLVIHDDIDLAFGRLKIKEKGGDGGHKGIRSLMDAFGGGDFLRLRIGVGHSEAGNSVTDHVLGRFTTDERGVLDQIIKRARDAVVTILCKGPKEAMDAFNNKRIASSS